MMHHFQIIEAKPYHCGRIVRMLRREHQNAMTIIGQKAHHELRTCFDHSAFRRAWLIDGQLAAVGGVVGTSLSSAGYIWLALTQEATKYPVAVFKEAKTQLREILQVKRKLVTTTYCDDATATRFAERLGFERREQSDQTIGWMISRANDIVIAQREAA